MLDTFGGFGGVTRPVGDLQIRVIRAKDKTRLAPLGWRIKNALRPTYIWGLVVNTLAQWFSKITGVVTVTSELQAVLIKPTGERIDHGVVSRRVITDTGVAFLVDDWDANGQDITTMNYHGCGTGTTAEAVTDTALIFELTTQLNPDNTRATGTRSQPTAPQYKTIGTLTFDVAAPVTEHGILSQSATGGGVLWDRSIFSVINVAALDSIEFSYTCTVNSGG